MCKRRVICFYDPAPTCYMRQQIFGYLLSLKMAEHKKKERETVLDLQKYLDQGVRVKLQGGREVRGVLKGFDPLVNVVLDECIEFIRDPADPYKLTDETRELGLVVCRGTQVSLISPTDGMEEIENPFVAQEG